MGLLDGKVAVVTGAGGGIGRVVARLMAEEGARVVVNDVGASLSGEGQDTSPGQTVVDEIKAAGGEAVLNSDSVASWEGAQQIVATALDSFGGLHAVVNSAGILRDRIFFKMDPQDWRSVIDVHLNGSFYVSRAAAPHFQKQESGAYVHMTSTSGLIGGTGQSNYGAAKAAIASLSKSIAMDMARFNVRSNCIAPFAWSRMISSIPTDTPAQQVRVAKLQRMGVEKIAPLAVVLASDAAKDVNAQVFCVRANEIFTLSQTRPLRSVHRSEGWTPQSVVEQALPALKASFYPMDDSASVFSWDPV